MGQYKEWGRISEILRQQGDLNLEIVGGVGLTPTDKVEVKGLSVLGDLTSLDQVVQLFDVDEVIFCNEGWDTKEIFDQMEADHARNLSFKIAPPEGDFIVGPQQIFTSRAQQQRHFRIAERPSRLSKRIFDIVGSSLLLLSFPLLFWRYQHAAKALKGIIQVLTGRQHLVGYQGEPSDSLPPLKPGLLSLRQRLKQPSDYPNAKVLDRHYALAYRWELDLEILVKSWSRIGNR